MNLQELRDVQDRERATDSLQQLPEEFYADVAVYIQELKDERESAAEQADDPFGAPEVGRLTDEIQTAEQVAESIYERRLGKVLDQASLAASDVGSGGAEGLTEEERALFEDVVSRITENKRRVLDVLAGEQDDETDDGATGDAVPSGDESAPGSGGPADATGETPEEASGRPDDAATDAGARSGPQDEGSVDAADVMGGDGAEETAGTPDGGSTASSGSAGHGNVGPGGTPDDPDRASDADAATDGGAAEHTTVHVTRDVGEVFGVDERVYSLAADDVVNLPAENARALLERDAAEPLE